MCVLDKSKRRSDRWTGEGCSLNGAARRGLTKEVTLQSRLEGGEGVDHANIWREKELSGPRPMAGVLVPSTFQRMTSRLAWPELSGSEGEEERWGQQRRQGESQLIGASWAQAQALRFLYHHTLLCSSKSQVTIVRLRTFVLSEIRVVPGPFTNSLEISFSLGNSALLQHSTQKYCAYTNHVRLTWLLASWNTSTVLRTNPLQWQSSVKRFLSTSSNAQFLSHYQRSVRFKEDLSIPVLPFKNCIYKECKRNRRHRPLALDWFKKKKKPFRD